MRAARDLAEMAVIFAALGVLGYPLVRRLRDLSNAELAAWSWIAGLLALAGAQAIVLLFGLRAAPWKLWTILAALALAFRDRAPKAPRTAGAPSRIATAAGILALGGLVLFSVNALSEPMWAWDFVAIWGLKGKMLYLSGGLPPRFFHDPELAFVHPSYPFLLSLLFSALSTLAGGWDSQALALLYPAFELATLLLTWGFLKRRCGPAAAAAGTVLTAGFFPLYQSFLVGLADIPMALGFVLAGSALLDALDAPGSARARPLLLSALFCCSLKKEGAVFLLLLAAAAAWVWIRDRGRSSVTAAAIFAAVPVLHQALLRAIRGAASDSGLPLVADRSKGRSRFPSAAPGDRRRPAAFGRPSGAPGDPRRRFRPPRDAPVARGPAPRPPGRDDRPLRRRPGGLGVDRRGSLRRFHFRARDDRSGSPPLPRARGANVGKPGTFFVAIFRRGFYNELTHELSRSRGSTA